MLQRRIKFKHSCNRALEMDWVTVMRSGQIERWERINVSNLDNRWTRTSGGSSAKQKNNNQTHSTRLLVLPCWTLQITNTLLSFPQHIAHVFTCTYVHSCSCTHILRLMLRFFSLSLFDSSHPFHVRVSDDFCLAFHRFNTCDVVTMYKLPSYTSRTFVDFFHSSSPHTVSSMRGCYKCKVVRLRLWCVNCQATATATKEMEKNKKIKPNSFAKSIFCRKKNGKKIGKQRE